MVDAQIWNDLLEAQESPTPFMRHEYLLALHRSGSAVAEAGWATHLVCLYDREGAGATLLAACPTYLKSHSYGEYVFDWAWADAYERHGLHYYPKLLTAVPFTPVPGSRLLARAAGHRRLLMRVLRQLCLTHKLSSAHLLFMDSNDAQAADDEGWMLRQTVQFHWLNREPLPYADFAEFLAGLQREKRKKIAQERRRVADAGVTFSTHQGEQIDAALWDFFYDCYSSTYAAHHSTPYLQRDFFSLMQQHMPAHWVMFVAEREGRRVACSLLAIDPQRGHAYGRYWGCTEYVPCLHFEACYYQPLAWCIAHGYRRFEGGAQGEHKMARGLMPVITQSAHWLAHPAFSDAVARHLEAEGNGIDNYVDELRERNPYRNANESKPA
ncbi:MAG: GNAT family N-acetyltransferase [Rubrivivax sp.]